MSVKSPSNGPGEHGKWDTSLCLWLNILNQTNRKGGRKHLLGLVKDLLSRKPVLIQVRGSFSDRSKSPTAPHPQHRQLTHEMKMDGWSGNFQGSGCDIDQDMTWFSLPRAAIFFSSMLLSSVWRADSLEKTSVLGKIEGKRRRGWQKMRWLDSITYSMDMKPGKLWRVWRSGKPGVLRSMGSQRVRHALRDWITITTIYKWGCLYFVSFFGLL